jgi:hypothetical protein
MASAFKRIQKFATSPEGKKLGHQLKDQASKPENKQKLKGLGRRIKRH